MNTLCLVVHVSLLLGLPPAGRAEQETLQEEEAPPILTDPRVHLVNDSFIRDELHLSADQSGRLDALRRELDGALFALRDYHPDHEDAQAKEMLDRLNTTWARIEGELTPAQRGRLEQIAWRAEGPGALARPEPARRLALRPEQRKQISEIRQTTREALQKLDILTAGEKRDESVSAEARRILEGKQHELIHEVLTDLQRRRWGEMLGEPLDLSKIKPFGMAAPELSGVDAWINSPPLTLAQLRGQVVVVHFWTFGCINCIRNWPIYERWGKMYAGKNVTIIGIHTPETESEYDIDRVKQITKEKGLSFPIAVDNHKDNWRAWTNRVWPSVYLVSKTGEVRYWWYGELNWKGMRGEQIMQKRIDELLAE